jgi:hypothetical protein
LRSEAPECSSGACSHLSATVARDIFTALVVIGATIQLISTATRSQLPLNQTPTPSNQTAPGDDPANSLATQTVDPAAVIFTTDVGMVLHAIKPASVADYEAAIVALQGALSTSTDEHVRRVAAGWRVWKAMEPDAQANVIYVHTHLPTSPDVDYRPSLWLDQLLAGAPAELLAKYRDSFAAPPSQLSLTELANMSVAPVAPANVTPEKPGNVSPR